MGQGRDRQGPAAVAVAHAACSPYPLTLSTPPCSHGQGVVVRVLLLRVLRGALVVGVLSSGIHKAEEGLLESGEGGERRGQGQVASGRGGARMHMQRRLNARQAGRPLAGWLPPVTPVAATPASWYSARLTVCWAAVGAWKVSTLKRSNFSSAALRVSLKGLHVGPGNHL